VVIYGRENDRLRTLQKLPHFVWRHVNLVPSLHLRVPFC
jgi:hypothetical protein